MSLLDKIFVGFVNKYLATKKLSSEKETDEIHLRYIIPRTCNWNHSKTNLEMDVKNRKSKVQKLSNNALSHNNVQRKSKYHIVECTLNRKRKYFIGKTASVYRLIHVSVGDQLSKCLTFSYSQKPFLNSTSGGTIVEY